LICYLRCLSHTPRQVIQFVRHDNFLYATKICNKENINNDKELDTGGDNESEQNRGYLEYGRLSLKIPNITRLGTVTGGTVPSLKLNRVT
jgi:hypothetical protein